MNTIFKRAMLAAVALCAPIAVLADVASKSAAPSSPIYALRDAIDGSMIQKQIVRSSVPFDKRYADLTQDQKNVLRQDYESLGPQDETPFPEQGLRDLVKPMMRLAEAAGTRGDLVASVQVGADGQPRSVKFFETPGSSMTELAAAALMHVNYTPASCHGQPCAMDYVLRLEFNAPPSLPLSWVWIPKR